MKLDKKQKDNNEQKKKAYKAPKVISYGKVADLTKTCCGSKNDTSPPAMKT